MRARLRCIALQRQCVHVLIGNLDICCEARALSFAHASINHGRQKQEKQSLAMTLNRLGKPWSAPTCRLILRSFDDESAATLKEGMQGV